MFIRSTRATIWVCLIIALPLASHSEATDDVTQFDFGASSYDCMPTGELICLGDAHKYIGNPNGSYNGNSDGSFSGKLSLIKEIGQAIAETSEGAAGIAYYNKPVRMLDPSSGRSASFTTTFAFAAISMDWDYSSRQNTKPLDGMTFVVSADSKTLGAAKLHLGFFRGARYRGDPEDGTNSFKSIVVEFDSWKHTDGIWNDINENHVSFDFQNVTAVTSQNADNINVYFWKPETHYAWVEYSASMQQLELRVSNSKSRPVRPLLFLKVDLYDVVDEYMWVGFSGAIGRYYGNYYIWDWTFTSSFAPSQHSKGGTNHWITVGIPVGLAGMLAMLAMLVGAFLLGRRFGKGAKRRSENEISPLPLGL